MITDEALVTLRSMASALAVTSPLSAAMLVNLSTDVEADGPISRLIGDHPESGSQLYCLRAVAGVRFLTLTGNAPELADHLAGMTAHMGERAFVAKTWELFRDTLLGHPAEIMSALCRPVQQHQPGRAGVLLNGLAMLAAPKVRLLELGACAGLNLLLDRYRWFGPDWLWGDASSSVRLTVEGRSPGEIEIVDRAGCDLHPRDAGDATDAMILRSFIPPEREVEMMELDDAIAVAAASGLRVDEADAVDWLAGKLHDPVADRSLYTVVWHSLFWGYLDLDSRLALESILSAAATRMRLAKISFEPESWLHQPRLQVTLYS